MGGEHDRSWQHVRLHASTGMIELEGASDGSICVALTHSKDTDGKPAPGKSDGTMHAMSSRSEGAMHEALLPETLFCAESLPTRAPRILLAEDDAAFRSVLRETLEAEGYEVHAVASGHALHEALTDTLVL